MDAIITIEHVMIFMMDDRIMKHIIIINMNMITHTAMLTATTRRMFIMNAKSVSALTIARTRLANMLFIENSNDGPDAFFPRPSRFENRSLTVHARY